MKKVLGFMLVPGELRAVACGDDVNALPFEMFVNEFGAGAYDIRVAAR